MKTSSYRKVHRDVLLEFIYDETNVISEPYRILKNSKDLINSYIAGDSTITSNSTDNQLFKVDGVQNKYSKINTSQYSFLSLSDFTPSDGIRHDTIKIYLPSNYAFGEYQGFYMRVYTYDYQNKKLYDLSNFYFDATDATKSDLLTSFTPPLLYEDRIWNKYIQINVPSVFAVASQRTNGIIDADTINYNLTSGRGLSQTAPVFIDFQFITRIQQTGSIRNYLTTQRFTTQVPQIPDLQNLQLFMNESQVGDFFEIYPRYNESFDEFTSFMESSKSLGKVYYIEYNITIFEQNIKGKSAKFVVEDEFTEKIEYRPILKYSTSKATIDVEMRLIDRVDGSIVVRKSAYGLKTDQISKYGLRLKSIKIRNADKPKIYNRNISNLYHIDELGKTGAVENRIKVPVPSLIHSSKYIPGTSGSIQRICAFSNQALNKVSQDTLINYHYIGKMKIPINPFDNIFRFIIAYKSAGTVQTIEPLDLSNCHDLKMVFKNDDSTIEFSQYFDSQTNTRLGMCSFKVGEDNFLKIKNLYKSELNNFYITTTNEGVRTVIYSGIFIPSDLIETTISDGSDDIDSGKKTGIIDDPNISKQETAIVTRRKVPSSTVKKPNTGKTEKSKPNTSIANKYGINTRNQ